MDSDCHVFKTCAPGSVSEIPCVSRGVLEELTLTQSRRLRSSDSGSLSVAKRSTPLTQVDSESQSDSGVTRVVLHIQEVENRRLQVTLSTLESLRTGANAVKIKERLQSHLERRL